MGDILRNKIVLNSFWRGLIWFRGSFSTERPVHKFASGATRSHEQHAAPSGNVEVVLRSELTGCRRWPEAFSLQHKDRRYHELVEDTIQPKFNYRYFSSKTGRACRVPSNRIS
jgi:hypothetical protein